LFGYIASETGAAAACEDHCDGFHLLLYISS
jgi:hypothetical protein